MGRLGEIARTSTGRQQYILTFYFFPNGAWANMIGADQHHPNWMRNQNWECDEDYEAMWKEFQNMLAEGFIRTDPGNFYALTDKGIVMRKMFQI